VEVARPAGLNRLKDRSVPIDVIRVPMALGADREGVDRGATELDNALRRRLEQRGFPDILARLSSSAEITVTARGACVRLPHPTENALHVDAIAAASQDLAAAVRAAVSSGNLALVIGGDHALSIGSLAGAGSDCRLGVIWLDAHGDINTPETSPSGHVHGMPLAAAIGRGPRELVAVGAQADLQLDDLVYIGVRDLDPGERRLLRESPALVFSMAIIDSIGIDAAWGEAARRLRERRVDAVHVSFDLDVLDPAIMSGTGTRVPGGLTYREAHRLLTLLHECDLPIVSVDIVELNPTLDPDGASTEVAAALTAVLLGEEML
jgi:arginase